MDDLRESRGRPLAENRAHETPQNPMFKETPMSQSRLTVITFGQRGWYDVPVSRCERSQRKPAGIAVTVHPRGDSIIMDTVSFSREL